MDEIYLQMDKIMRDKGYPGSVRETAIGTVESAKDQKNTLAKVQKLLRQNLTAREMAKALQPIIRGAETESGA